MPVFHLQRAARGVGLTLGLLAMLGALAIPPVAATSYPATRAIQIPRSSYVVVVPPGSVNAGWSWLRSSNYSDIATYRFNSFNPAVLSYDHQLQIVLAPLVTNGLSGGAGWTTRIHVTVTYTYTGGSRTWTYHDTLVNPFPFRSSLFSNGVGYQTYGHQTLTQAQFTHGAGALKVEITRDASYSVYGFHPHVAVNTAAVSLWYLAR